MTTEILTLAIVAGGLQIANQIIGLVKILVEFHIEQKKKHSEMKEDSNRSERLKSRKIRN